MGYDEDRVRRIVDDAEKRLESRIDEAEARLSTEISASEKRVLAGFPNEDPPGHRVAHEGQILRARRWGELKFEVSKSIAKWAAVTTLAFLAGAIAYKLHVPSQVIEWMHPS